MLRAFLTANREELIDRARAKVATRSAPQPTDEELSHGVPLFLSQLVDALALPEGDAPEAVVTPAAKPEVDFLRMGFTVAQVIHDYGDICQAVKDLAIERDARLTEDDLRRLNLCLDEAVARAVTDFARQRERDVTQAGTERLGFLAHELRNLLTTAMLSFDTIRKGVVGVNGAVGSLHTRSLLDLRDLVDRSLAEVRLNAGIHKLERVALDRFMEEVEVSASIHARARGVGLTVSRVANGIAVDADRQILASALANLLQNAFKFTPEHGKVSLRTVATTDLVVMDVQDECGGLPPGKVEELFRPYHQQGSDRTGVGLGLTISLHAVKASGGELRVRNLPGRGCVFSIELPRRS